MSALWNFLKQRLSEPSSWLGLAAFFASTGTAIASAGYSTTGLIIGAVGAGCGGVGAFVSKEGQRPQP
jgi:hypothetical protein